MPRILRSFSDPEDYEFHGRERLRETSLKRRLEQPNNSRYIFISKLRGENGVIAKYCQVEGVQTRKGKNGIHIVQFGVYDPQPGRTRFGSVGYFKDGFYTGPVREDRTLRLSEGKITDAEVASGFFVKNPHEEQSDNLLFEAKIRMDREEGAI